MLNWFKRNKDKQTELPSSHETQVSPDSKEINQDRDQEQAEKTETEQPDYLNWAKSAYANIKKQQDLSKSELSPEEIEAEKDTSPESGEKAQELEEEELAKPEELEQPETAPAWMQKSDRLEVLKETATRIEEEQKEAETSLDDDFVWSAQILANEGRTPDDVSEEEFHWLKKLRQGLGKTRINVVNQLKAVIGQGPLNQDAVMEIEALLLSADVGIEATDHVIETLQARLREEALPPDEAIAYLKNILQDILDQPLQKLTNREFAPQEEKLNIWLLTGVNGAGKTTTVGKLANLVKKSGYNCVIAAADTFRAAAVEQVKVWGERSDTLVIANPGKNTDPAAVVYDGINAALSRKADVLLVDTAGRLQNKKNLMEELAKIRRIIDKKASNAKVESLLVLDATLGQNGLRQAQVFSEAAKLTGVVLTKLDGTAKGGVALAVSQQLDLPIRFIGAGEGIEDLRPFSSYEFVEALLSN
jgi:fused signal recognition particle receptor